MSESVTLRKQDSSGKINRVHKPYRRHNKRPYSYITLIAMAIRDSPKQRLTLSEINDYLIKNFEFFRGTYDGWRNSIRHNLSLNECFIKILRDTSRPWGKDNYWIINPNSEYISAESAYQPCRRRTFGRQWEDEVNERNVCHINQLAETVKENRRYCIPAIRSPRTPYSSLNKTFTIDNILASPTRVAPVFSSSYNGFWSDIHNARSLPETSDTIQDGRTDLQQASSSFEQGSRKCHCAVQDHRVTPEHFIMSEGHRLPLASHYEPGLRFYHSQFRINPVIEPIRTREFSADTLSHIPGTPPSLFMPLFTSY